MTRLGKIIVGIIVLIIFIIITILIVKKYSQAPETEIIYKPEKTIRILEGWNIQQIAQYLAQEEVGSSDDFLDLVGHPQIDYRKNTQLPKLQDFSKRFDFLADKPDYYGLEGYLFPDTYRVYNDATLEDVVVKMLENFGTKLTPQMRIDITKQGRTIYQILIMASLIEKEAPINNSDSENRDARIISGIFWDRLKIGQALQSDATLSYILGDNKPQHSGQELEIKSPYNTYQYPGLPPGPICNPGLVAIEAAIYPIYTDYNYFLTPLDSQQVIYAITYEEHLQNKYKYLK